MKLIESSVELLEQKSGIDGIYKQIELAGRTCYKSEDKITENSAKEFVERMINSGHTAMLEHGTVYLYLEVNPDNAFSKYEYPSCKFTAPYIWSDVVGSIQAKYGINQYSKVKSDYTTSKHCVYITSNYRTLVENNWLEDLRFICEPTEFHEKRITLKFITSRGISHELVRHRAFSFAQESQRYCGYDRNKFNNELAFVMPSWYQEAKYDSYKLNSFDKQLGLIEDLYMFFRDCNMQPQEAREILPNCTKTEVVMTGFISDWRHFFDLRYFGTTGKPHPDMLELTAKAKDVLTKNNLWNLIYPKDETHN